MEDFLFYDLISNHSEIWTELVSEKNIIIIFQGVFFIFGLGVRKWARLLQYSFLDSLTTENKIKKKNEKFLLFATPGQEKLLTLQKTGQI